MNVLILHGSTKSVPKRSITKAYIDFIKANFEEHTYDVFSIGNDIKRIESDEDYFYSIMDKISSADLIFWAVPVYSGLVPSSVKRFIELVYERDRREVFKGKYAGALVANASIFDNCAIAYLRAVSEDLGSLYIDSFSATIYPVITPPYKESLRFFLKGLFEHAAQGLPVMREYLPVKGKSPLYSPAEVADVKKSGEKRVAIVADFSDRESNIAKMVDSYIKLSPYEVELVNLNGHNYSQCIDCLSCSAEFVCALKDGFQDMFREKVLKADGVIFAGEIRDRFLSTAIKLFLDREFCYNHGLIHQGRLFGAIIAGPLAENGNIRKVLTSLVELRGGSMLDIISDELEDSASLTALIGRFAARMAEGIRCRAGKPFSFAGVGSQKIMRDMAYMARFPFKADYENFKTNLFKAFPQKKRAVIFKSIMLGLLAKIKGHKAVLEIYKEARNKAFRGLLLSDE